MKKASQIFEVMKEYLHSKGFLDKCRKSPEHFLRLRQLPHTTLFLLILNLLKDSIPKELNSFCKICNTNTTTRAAITKARAKLNPGAFIAMNDLLVKEFYCDNDVKLFHGLIPLAVDGSTLELPLNSPGILEKYGYATNQTDRKIPMARISQLFDVINGISLDAIIAPYESSERDLAILHIEKIKSTNMDILNKILVIFDRGYPSLPFIFYLLKNKIHFILRSNKQFLREVNEVLHSKKRDEVINISLRRASSGAKVELKRLFPNLNMDEIISFRVVIVTLKTGEKEILLTSLLDKKKYPHSIFCELYFKRWGIEENYKFHKVELEIENFSGMTCHAVEQDFHATVLASNARAILSLEASEELKLIKNKKEKKYIYEINKNVSMNALKGELIFVLLNPAANVEAFCTGVKSVMKKNLVPIRPGRTFERINKHDRRKYHMNLR
jgi:hypothetical protein